MGVRDDGIEVVWVRMRIIDFLRKKYPKNFKHYFYKFVAIRIFLTTNNYILPSNIKSVIRIDAFSVAVAISSLSQTSFG